MNANSAPSRHAPQMLGCLASGRTNVRCVCLLQGGAVSILSPPVPPTQSPAPVQQLRLADPVEAIACSTDGAFLAVASRTELRVYAVAEGAPGSDGHPHAHLRWRAPLHAHVRGLAISGSAALPSVVVAVGGAPGLRLLVGGGGNGSGMGERGGEGERRRCRGLLASGRRVDAAAAAPGARWERGRAWPGTRGCCWTRGRCCDRGAFSGSGVTGGRRVETAPPPDDSAGF